MSQRSEHPEFVIVCDHGVRGGQLDEVARYTWPEHRNPHTALLGGLSEKRWI
jgi:hypothetical protein